MFQSTYPSIGRSLTTPLMRLRPLQGPTRHGPPTRDHPVACKVTSRPVVPRDHLALGNPKGHREPDHPEGSPGAQPPRRAAEMPLSATLMEFPSPSTHEPRRVHSTPACLTGYVPSTGFRTLSTACSSPGRPALFHAGNAHGVSLFRGFPSPPGPADSSPRDYPLDVSPPHQRVVDARRPPPRAETRFTDLCRLQGLAPTVNPYHHRTVTSLVMADPLLSFGASPGSCPTLTGHVACYVCRSCASPGL